MRANWWSIVPIFVMAQACLAVRLPVAESANEVMQKIVKYRQSIRDLVLLSESAVVKFRDNLPQFERECDDYLSKLSDYKNNFDNNAAENKEMLNSWYEMLTMIKAETKTPAKDTTEITKNHSDETFSEVEATTERSTTEDTTPITTTENSLKLIYVDLFKKTEKQRIENLKIKYLDKQLNELKYHVHLTDTQKSLVLVVSMVEWDETYDGDSFAEEVDTTFDDIFLEDRTMPKLYVEYFRLKNLYAQMFQGEQDYESVFRIQHLGKYLDFFKADDLNLIPQGNSDHISSKRLHTYRFWRRCLISTCPDETFWKLFMLN